MVIAFDSAHHNMGTTVLSYLSGFYLKKEPTLIISVGLGNTLALYSGLPKHKFETIKTLNSSLQAAISTDNFIPSVYFQEVEDPSVIDKKLYYYNTEEDITASLTSVQDFCVFLKQVNKMFKYVIVDMDMRVNAFTHYSDLIDTLVYVLPPNIKDIKLSSVAMENHKRNYLKEMGVSFKADIVPVICKMEKGVVNPTSVFRRGENKLGKIYIVNYSKEIIKVCNKGQLYKYATKLFSTTKTQDTVTIMKQIEVILTEGGKENG